MQPLECFFVQISRNPFSKSGQNCNEVIPLNRANSGDLNGVILTFIPILEGEIWKLPGFCLPALPGWCRLFRTRTIYRWKDLLNGSSAQLRSLRTAQYLWRKLGINLEAILTRLYLAFPISHQPHYGFPSSLISTESPYPGESSYIECEIRGRVSTENVGNYRNGPFGSSSGHCCLPNWVPFLLVIAPHSTNILLRFYDDLEGLGYVFGVEKRVSLVRFQGFKYFQVGMGL